MLPRKLGSIPGPKPTRGIFTGGTINLGAVSSAFPIPGAGTDAPRGTITHHSHHARNAFLGRQEGLLEPLSHGTLVAHVGLDKATPAGA